jgi:hypothetical protein
MKRVAGTESSKAVVDAKLAKLPFLGRSTCTADHHLGVAAGADTDVSDNHRFGRSSSPESELMPLPIAKLLRAFSSATISRKGNSSTARSYLRARR